MDDPSYSVLIAILPFLVIFVPFYMRMMFGKVETPCVARRTRICVVGCVVLAGLGILLVGQLSHKASSETPANASSDTEPPVAANPVAPIVELPDSK